MGRRISNSCAENERWMARVPSIWRQPSPKSPQRLSSCGHRASHPQTNRVYCIDFVNRRRPRRRIVNRECPKHFPKFIEDGRRPAGVQTVGKRKVAEVLPQRIGGYVGYIDSVPDKGRGAARAHLWSDFDSIDCLAIDVSKAGCCSMQEMLARSIQQQY